MNVATVTLLFTDLVGSTELLDELGEDATERLRRTHFQLLRDAVVAGGGEEVKTLGDGLMAVFASAVDALGVAVAVQRSVDQHNRAGERPLRVRVGLHVGEPIRDEGDYFGTPVVIAKRLCDRAQGGQIICSELVRSLVGSRGGFQFRDLGPLALKGLSEPVRGCEVGWEPEARAPVSAPGSLVVTERSPFVGRGGEMAQLRDSWERTRAGARALVFVAGEPGIGKSRLARELARQATADGATVLLGRCDEESVVPYQPFVEALSHDAAGRGTDGRRELLRTGGPELVRLVPSLADVAPPRRGGLADDADTERYRLFEGVAAWLSELASHGPVLLLLEDLHWADRATLVLLRHVLRHTRLAGVLVLATYRDVELVPNHPLADALADLRREQRYERIVLAGLGQTDVAELVQAWAGVQPEAFIEVVAAETEGNPFFVEELLLHFDETGDLGVPEGVREVVARRLAQLSERTNRILTLAAVLGRSFELRVLARVSELGDDELVEALDEALRARVLIEDSDAGVGQFRFAHALLPRSLYDQLTAARRVRVHRRVGELLEELHADSLHLHLPELAHHFAESAALADDGGRAVTYCSWAALHAMEFLAYEEAVSWYRRALDLLDNVAGADGSQRGELLLGLGDALMRAREAEAGHETLLEAADWARSFGTAEQLARAALSYTGELWRDYTVVNPTAIALVDEALAALGETHPALRVRLLARQAAELYYTPEVERRTALSAKALAVADEVGDPTLHFLARASQLIATRGPDASLDEQRAAADELVSIARRLGQDGLLMRAHQLRSTVLLLSGDVAAADTEIDTIERLSEELRMPAARASVLMYRAMRLALRGQFTAARSMAEEAFAAGERLDPDTAAANFGAQLLMTAWGSGELEPMAEAVSQLAAQFPQFPGYRCALAFVAAELERPDAAAEAFNHFAREGFANLPRDDNWLAGMWLLAIAAASIGDVDAAATLYDMLLPFAGRTVSIGTLAICTGSASLPLGVLAATLGRDAEAVAHFEQAVADAAHLQAAPFGAYAQCRFAELRDRQGDADGAAALAREALRVAQDLGMRGLEARVRKLPIS